MKQSEQARSNAKALALFYLLATSQQTPGGAAGALTGPPTCFVSRYKADTKQTGSKQLTSPADTRPKGASASLESLAPL